MKIEKWEWCFSCDAPFARCPDCGNNSCNAGCGDNNDGKSIHRCDTNGFNEALEKQRKDAPKRPTKEQILEYFSELENMDKLLEEIFGSAEELKQRVLNKYSKSLEE